MGKASVFANHARSGYNDAGSGLDPQETAMPKGRVLTVECRCGQPLFKYYKGGRGRLIKCYLDEIRQDYVGILEAGHRANRDLQDPISPTCPACGKDLGIIRIVRGRPALKINQGAVKETRV
jgi:hypothetical protein